MTENTNQLDLNDRLSLIETMIAEGRRTTERWGWTFVLWGVAYYVAIAWSTWGGHSNLAWPVTMIAAALVTALPFSRRQNQPETTIGRAIGAVWMAMGISLFTVLMSLAISGRYESHVFMAIIGAMLGTANATSSGGRCSSPARWRGGPWP
jgi:fatty acid desaturase